jgi:hypothetical protein
VKNCRKCSAASDSDSSTSTNGSSDEVPPKCHRHRKARLDEDEVMDEVVDNEPEEDAVEVVDLDEYRAMQPMLEHDVQEYEFEKGEDEFVIDD